MPVAEGLTPVPPRRVSVILSTYNQPRWLEKALWGYAAQTHRDFELVVADDGSGEETREVIARARDALGRAVVHVWHEDRGFRKTEILNRAIIGASGDYLVFSDGDCVPRADFVATHVQLAAPARFLSGGYLKLPMALSEALTQDDVASGRAFDARWLAARGWQPGRRRVRLLRQRAMARALDALTPTTPSWNGHNASTWREALLAVNGFDLDMRYGGEDRALGERLEHAGLRGVQIRHRAPCLHLDHGRPYVDAAALAHNRAVRDRIRDKHEVRARFGIAELDSFDSGDAATAAAPSLT